MPRLRTSIAIVLLFALSACLRKPVFNIEVVQPDSAASATPFAAGTEMALASPTPFVEESLPTIAPTPVRWPTDFSPVLYGGKRYDTPFFILLGGVSQNEWLVPDASVTRYGGEATYSLHTLTQASKYFIWGKAPQSSPTCQNYFIGTDPGLEESNLVGVVDGWNVMKRDVTDLSADGPFYRQAVIDWLAAQGVSSPQIDKLQIHRVDLEGDGTDEIFISATRLDGSQHITREGDYSVILMRKVRGNEAVTVFITGDVYREPETAMLFPRTYSITNFIDLNQDGVLEVVVDIQKWEGFGASVFQVIGENVIQVLKAVC